jgi:hypothetical protein
MPDTEGEMAKGDGKKLTYVTTVGGESEVGSKTQIDGSLKITAELSVIGAGKLIVRGPMTAPGPRGRPKAAGISMEIFQKRRKGGIPLAESKMDEAAAICAAWPPGQSAPMAKTVARHIAKAFDAAPKGPRPLR